MQTLPYTAIKNQHISHVYELYYSAFEKLRKVTEVRTLDDNDRFCQVIKECLHEHLSVIPKLAMGVLEIQETVPSEECDRLMTALLRSVSDGAISKLEVTDKSQRISRRVIAEQHLALTETFHSPWHFPNASQPAPGDEFVGEVFLKCNAKEIIDSCSTTIAKLARDAYGPSVQIPEIQLEGNIDTTFPYIPSHIEYVIGELLRNSTQAVIQNRRHSGKPPPIQILICDTNQHVIFRISDQGGGIDRDVLPYLWSFTKGPRKQKRLHNLQQVPKLAATLEELQHPTHDDSEASASRKDKYDGSLSSFTSRPPELRLGIGLPMSRIYAEYWAGSLEVHSLEGYGTDAFLQISKLGNKNEVLSTRASMDAV